MYKKCTNNKSLCETRKVAISVFKEVQETKRVVFKVRIELAERLKQAKEKARWFGKKLDADSAIDKAVKRFLKKAEKKTQDLKKERETSTTSKQQRG